MLRYLPDIRDQRETAEVQTSPTELPNFVSYFFERHGETSVNKRHWKREEIRKMNKTVETRRENALRPSSFQPHLPANSVWTWVMKRLLALGSAFQSSLTTPDVLAGRTSCIRESPGQCLFRQSSGWDWDVISFSVGFPIFFYYLFKAGWINGSWCSSLFVVFISFFVIIIS